MSKAVFIDKDGTLVEDVPYNVDPARLRLTRNASAGIRELAAAGFRLLVVSNQPGIAYRFFRQNDLLEMERRIRFLLPELAAFYYCPHSREAGCGCRKPAPGLLERAAREHGVALERSWMVGDILDDVEAGRRAGCRTVLLDNGNETEWQLTAQRCPDRIARDLPQAAALILQA